MNGLCKPSLGALCLMAKISLGKKLNLNRYISEITDIDEKWFVIFECTINHLSFGYVRSSQLEYYFSCFASFLYFFFLLLLAAFKPLNALYSKFERLKIPRRTFARQISVVPGWGIPFDRVLQNFELLNP